MKQWNSEDDVAAATFLAGCPEQDESSSDTASLQVTQLIIQNNFRDYKMSQNNDKHEINFSQHVKYMPMGYDKPKVMLQSSSVATVYYWFHLNVQRTIVHIMH